MKKNPNTSRSRPHETVSLDSVIEAFGITPSDEFLDRNNDFVFEMSRVDTDGLSPEEIEAATFKAQDFMVDQLYEAWQIAVNRVLDQVADDVGVRLVSKWRTGKVDITPEVDWATAARKLRDTIHGVGYFEIPSEDLRAPKKFVLSHWKHARDYPDVYGRESYTRLFDRDLEGNLRNL